MSAQERLPDFQAPPTADPGSAGGVAQRGLGDRPTLSIFTSLSEARADWQQLTAAAYGTPYQSQNWLEAWCAAFREPLSVEPVIAVGRLGDRPVVLLPLQMERSAGVSALTFLGHQHGNQNTGIWDGPFYEAVPAAEIASFLRAICERTGADLLKLQNVPRHWHGREHPLVEPGAPASPSPVFTCTLGNDFDKLFAARFSKSSRKNLLRKQRHLEAAGGFRVVRAKESADIARGLEAFLEQRALRAAEAGIPNAFADEKARAFLARLLGLQDSGGVMDLWYLETGGKIRSTYLCAEQAGTLYTYSNSIAHDDMLSHSPGLVLIKEIIARACAAPDLSELDLGLGEERYKTSWAGPLPLADSLVALTFKGRLRLGLDSAFLKTKATIRNSSLLWPMVRRLRKLKAGLS
jgi:CelD/BcsL family acetyltransferase involved in cellulose biosynthesis